MKLFYYLLIVLVLSSVASADVYFEDTFTTSDKNLYEYDSWNNYNNTSSISIYSNQVRISGQGSDLKTVHNVTGLSGKSTYDLIVNITPAVATGGTGTIHLFQAGTNADNDVKIFCSNKDLVLSSWNGELTLESNGCSGTPTGGQLLIETYDCHSSYCKFNVSWKGVSKSTGRQYFNYPLTKVVARSYLQSGAFDYGYFDNVCVADDYTECFASASDPCTPPDSGDWTLTEDCTISSNVNVPANIYTSGYNLIIDAVMTFTNSNQHIYAVADSLVRLTSGGRILG